MPVKLSIVTISYNQAPYLEQCIKSIVEQDVQVEYIIIDGGSTDGSVDIIKRYQDKISYWISEKDRGPANALNKGFAIASGDYIGYINSDDYLLPGSFACLAEIIEKHAGFDVYYGAGYIENSGQKSRTLVSPTKWNLGVYRSGFSMMFQQSIFFRRKKIEEGIYFNEANATHWDGEHLVDLDLANATFFRYRQAISVFRLHELSLSGGVNGATGERKYKIEVERVNKKIDASKKVIFKHKLFWIGWLLFFETASTSKRILRRILGKSC